MSRTAFLELLARAVRDKAISEGEAARLLRMFDANELEISDDDLPLPVAVAVRPPTGGDVEAAVLALAALGTIRALYQRRKQVRELLQDRLQAEAKRLAKRLTDGAAVKVWQESFSEAVTRNIIQQRIVGAGRIIAPQDVARTVVEQRAYLSRFADEVALRKLAGEPPSYLQLAARSALYAKAGRAESFRGEGIPEGVPVPGSVCLGHCRCRLEWGDGIVEYISQDDDATCGPCLDAEGVYPVSKELAA